MPRVNFDNYNEACEFSKTLAVALKIAVKIHRDGDSWWVNDQKNEADKKKRTTKFDVTLATSNKYSIYGITRELRDREIDHLFTILETRIRPEYSKPRIKKLADGSRYKRVNLLRVLSLKFRDHETVIPEFRVREYLKEMSSLSIDNVDSANVIQRIHEFYGEKCRFKEATSKSNRAHLKFLDLINMDPNSDIENARLFSDFLGFGRDESTETGNFVIPRDSYLNLLEQFAPEFALTPDWYEMCAEADAYSKETLMFQETSKVVLGDLNSPKYKENKSNNSEFVTARNDFYKRRDQFFKDSAAIIAMIKSAIFKKHILTKCEASDSSITSSPSHTALRNDNNTCLVDDLQSICDQNIRVNSDNTLEEPVMVANQEGFYPDGTHAITGTRFDLDGFDSQGFDAKYYDRNGISRRGYDRNGNKVGRDNSWKIHKKCEQNAIPDTDDEGNFLDKCPSCGWDLSICTNCGEKVDLGSPCESDYCNEEWHERLEEDYRKALEEDPEDNRSDDELRRDGDFIEYTERPGSCWGDEDEEDY